MEGVGLVTGFQFLFGLAAVFAEEVTGCSKEKGQAAETRFEPPPRRQAVLRPC